MFELDLFTMQVNLKWKDSLVFQLAIQFNHLLKQSQDETLQFLWNIKKLSLTMPEVP